MTNFDLITENEESIETLVIIARKLLIDELKEDFNEDKVELYLEFCIEPIITLMGATLLKAYLKFSKNLADRLKGGL